MKSTIMSRRALLGGASTALAGASLARPAKADAEFEFKLGVNTPDTHPLTVRFSEAAKDIAARSSGRLTVTVFPNSQLGGDPEMLSQVRAGGIELLAAPSMTLSTLVPLSGCRASALPSSPTTRSGPPWTAGSARSSARPSPRVASCR